MGADRGSMTTIGYYSGDKPANCDAIVARADNQTPIQDIAAGLANHIHAEYTSKGKAVEHRRPLDGRPDRPRGAARLGAGLGRLPAQARA